MSFKKKPDGRLRSVSRLTRFQAYFVSPNDIISGRPLIGKPLKSTVNITNRNSQEMKTPETPMTLSVKFSRAFLSKVTKARDYGLE